jgi:predicted Fe-S protein YdhL (DUF1289 family)
VIKSPCNNICTPDPVSDLCIGCGRSPKEIENWIGYSNKQKNQILNEIKKRNKIDNKRSYVLNKGMFNINKITKKEIFSIGLILILTLSRILPHAPNFTPVIAVAIMSGYLFSNIKHCFLIVLFSMLVTDFFLGFYNNMIFVYGSLFLITFIFYKISKKISLKNLFIYSFVGSVIFFIVSNFGVWALGSIAMNGIPYEKSLGGLIECYFYAIPFFGNTFISTIIFSYSAFGASYIFDKKIYN